jgi:hypothetical protein
MAGDEWPVTNGTCRGEISFGEAYLSFVARIDGSNSRQMPIFPRQKTIMPSLSHNSARIVASV